MFRRSPRANIGSLYKNQSSGKIVPSVTTKLTISDYVTVCLDISESVKMQIAPLDSDLEHNKHLKLRENDVEFRIFNLVLDRPSFYFRHLRRIWPSFRLSFFRETLNSSFRT